MQLKLKLRLKNTEIHGKMQKLRNRKMKKCKVEIYRKYSVENPTFENPKPIILKTINNLLN